MCFSRKPGFCGTGVFPVSPVPSLPLRVQPGEGTLPGCGGHAAVLCGVLHTGYAVATPGLPKVGQEQTGI